MMDVAISLVSLQRDVFVPFCVIVETVRVPESRCDRHYEYHGECSCDEDEVF